MAKTAELRIYSVIGTNEDEFSSDNLIAFLEKNKSASELKIRIKSPGGSVREGWTIYDLLKASGKKVTTIAEGELYSIATVIYLAGEEREILPNADGLIHMPRIPNPEGDFQAADLRLMAEYMDQEEIKILNLYHEVTGQSIDLLRDYMNKETMLSADDMVTLGFATKKIEHYKAVAYFNYKLNNNQMDEKAFFEKLGATLDSAVAKIAGFSRLPVTNQELTDAAGNKLTLEKESGSPAVGDKATPDGEFVMASGETIKVVDGVVTEIQVAEPMVDDLKKAQDQVKELEAKVAEMEAANKLEKEALAKETTEANALVLELRALKNTWKPDGRSKTDGVNKVDGIDIDRVKENLAKLKNNK